MNRTWIPLAILFIAVTPSLRADEPPEMQLEFVQKLRDKNYADLALEYLESLRKNPPAAIKSSLSMELAKTRILLAKDKDPAQRLVLLKAARDEMNAFVKANPNRPETARAQLELARLASQQGKALLSRALRTDDEKMQVKDAGQAEMQFTQAGKELADAAKVLGALVAKYKDPKTDEEKEKRTQYQRDWLDARLERGLSLMDLAQTYIDTSREDINKKKAEAVDAAKKVFEDVIKEDAEAPSAAMAAAWLVRCNQVGQDPLKAKQWYDAVMRVKDSYPEATRWAEYFHIQGIFTDATSKLKPLKKVQEARKECEQWLKRFRGFKNSHVGQGVQYELALALFKEGQLAKEKEQKSARVTKIYDQAQKILTTLSESDSDFSQKATDLGMRISFMRMGADTPLDKLKDFDECYLKAYYEMSLMKQVQAKLAAAGPDQAKKLEAERKKHLKNVARAFTRALQLADAKTTQHKIDEARFYLGTAYLLTGDPYRAAIAGEALAREPRPGRRAATAAGIALEAYAALAARDNSDSNRHRLLDIASFILKDRQKVWQGEPVTPVAHYQLAMTFKRDQKFKEAIGELEQLTPEFPAYTFAQCQLVFTALDGKKKAPTEAEKKIYQDKLLAALKRIPQLPANSDPTSAALFFYAHEEYAKMLFREATDELNKNALAKADFKFREMEKFLKQLQDQLGKAKISPLNADKVSFSLKYYEKVARFGLADAQYRAGKYDKVLAPDQTGGTVAEVKKLAQKPGPIAIADYEITGQVLGLALRAYVQLGKMDEARQVLNILERLRGTEGEFADPTAQLKALIQDLETQVNTLQKAGDAEKLKVTVKNFSAFVDELAKNSGKKKMGPGDYFFLGHCYASLDQFQKAADMYKLVTEPKCLNKKDKLLAEEEKEIQTYWYAQKEYARMLRQIVEGDRHPHLGLAYKILSRLKAHPNGRGVLQAEAEIIKIYEDNNDFGRAITEWGKLMTGLQKNPKKEEPTMKELYFDAYYHYVYSTYKYSQSERAKASKRDQSMLRRAADYVIRLESIKDASGGPGEGWQMIGPRLRELMDKEPPLRDKYEELKRAAK